MTPEQFELLRDLTIVIPTYNRPLDLERAIEYWRDTPITLHILDGSQISSFIEGKLPGIPTITYHYFPASENDFFSENYYKRLKFASTLPITKYSAIIGEDDFFTISGLCECVKILSTDKSICSVTGISLGFENLSEVLRWGLREDEQHVSPIFEHKSPKRRLKALKSAHSPPLFYGIFDTDCWRKSFELSFGEKFKTDVIGGERLFHAVATTLGPTTKINKVVSLRRFTSEDLIRERFEKVGHERGAYDRYLNNDRNKVEVAAYYGVLAKAICVVLPFISQKKALRLSRKILSPNFYNSQSSIKYQLRRNLAIFLVASGRIVPKNIRLSINRALGTKVTQSLGFNYVKEDLKPAFVKQTLSDLFFSWKDHEIACSRSEIESVEKLLLKPREELRLHANL